MRSTLYNRYKLFDITLRDIQRYAKRPFTLTEQNKTVDFIYNTYKPYAIELGSIHEKSTIASFNHCKEMDYDAELYVRVSNIYDVEIAKKAGINRFVFMTSASNSFQLKHTNRTIDQAKYDLKELHQLIDVDDKIKLTIECINECPVEGKLNEDYIYNELYFYMYNYFDIHSMCLSDTCGNLTSDEFDDLCVQIRGNMLRSNISMHLRKNASNPGSYHVIERAKQLNIRNFDVSAMLVVSNCPTNLHYSDIDAESI